MTLAEHLPPVGWADVATRTDLDHLEDNMGLRLDAGLANLRAAIERRLTVQTRALYVSVITTNATMISLLLLTK